MQTLFNCSDMSVPNLEYLSSQQALADLAAFITAMNTKMSLQKNNWIAFGGSYPGIICLVFGHFGTS